MPTLDPIPSISRDFCIILVTCKSKKEAGRIASSLLSKRLIACANAMPGIDSRFWWNGKIDRAREISLILKTKRVNFKKIEKEIKRLHSYEVPEIIAIPIIMGSAGYLGWIRKSIK